MKTITLSFDPAFLRLLPSRHRRLETRYCYEGKPSIKHVLEALGIPHTEVGEIHVNGNRIEISQIIEARQRYQIYPIGDTPPEAWSRSGILPPRFIVDTHLGKLAAYLRLLGFDTLYDNEYKDEELASISSQDQRILLTRDRGLLKRKIITSGFCPVQDDPEDQLRAVIHRFGLSNQIRPFSRCLRCNNLLLPIDKKRVAGRVPDQSFQAYDEYWLCQGCSQVYWKGTHYDYMEAFIQRVLE